MVAPRGRQRPSGTASRGRVIVVVKKKVRGHEGGITLTNRAHLATLSVSLSLSLSYHAAFTLALVPDRKGRLVLSRRYSSIFIKFPYRPLSLSLACCLPPSFFHSFIHYSFILSLAFLPSPPSLPLRRVVQWPKNGFLARSFRRVEALAPGFSVCFFIEEQRAAVLPFSPSSSSSSLSSSPSSSPSLTSSFSLPLFLPLFLLLQTRVLCIIIFG